MAKNNKVVNVGYCGYLEVVPSYGLTTSQPKQSVNTQTKTSMSRTAYNDKNYKVSNRCTKTHKSGNYVTKSGSVGYQQVARATSTVKVTDKVQGFTTEYQTQVNVKKVVYPTAAKSYKSSNKRINYH